MSPLSLHHPSFYRLLSSFPTLASYSHGETSNGTSFCEGLVSVSILPLILTLRTTAPLQCPSLPIMRSPTIPVFHKCLLTLSSCIRTRSTLSTTADLLRFDLCNSLRSAMYSLLQLAQTFERLFCKIQIALCYFVT